MWNHKTLEEFQSCVKDLLLEPDVRSMERIRQHSGKISCLDHCIFVSYLSFSICRRLRLNSVAAARAGLLHDLYLCDWNSLSVGRWRRLLIHPQMALENAEAHGLSDLERDIILKHMWPLTLRRVPRHRESFVVNLVDTLCASIEMLHLYRAFGAWRWLSSLSVPQPTLEGAFD
ncbi:MAG: HD family phosphohydrolase [Oscillospiraceae bacterium]|nr:HD family phosphohydrolase [Oscillospiraceae bacterium]